MARSAQKQQKAEHAAALDAAVKPVVSKAARPAAKPATLRNAMAKPVVAKPIVAKSAVTPAVDKPAVAKSAPAKPAATARAARKSPAATPRVRTRLGPRERERMIVDGAVRFFSEVGFSGQTRELSRRLDITQPLLYRYFPSKKALIDRVYKEVFLGNWDAGWEERLADRSRPLRERLVEFYSGYVRVLFRPEWIRLYMYSGLAGIGFNKRYMARIERLILKRIGIELRHEFGAPHQRANAPLKPLELEVIWQLHGGIFYYGVRRFIYGIGTHVDSRQMIEGAVDAFLATGKQMFAPAPAAGKRKRSAQADV